MKNANGSGYSQVVKTEEKGTDVNIASHLVNDAHKKLFQIAVVISNDSDLVEPVKIVTSELGMSVIVVSPFPKNSIQLKSIASSVRKLRKGVLSASQFSNIMSDNVGSFSKPLSW